MLNEITRGQLQEKLHILLCDFALSKNKFWIERTDLTEYVKSLQEIYIPGFRHQYSKLFEVVNKVFEDDDKDILVFQENLKNFRTFLMKEYSESHDNTDYELEVKKLLKIFDKLQDHLLLEISRRENFKSQDDKMIILQRKYTDMGKSAREIEDKIDTFSEKLSKIQTDFVAILAIFAAVVVAFSSGSNYMFSTLSAVSRAFTKEIVFITLICGLILMDTLFMLIYFIGSIIERDIGYKWYIAFLANIIVIITLIWICCI